VLPWQVNKMIFDSKMVDASTQTAADRILQRVMQLAPTSEDEAKKESETRKVGAAVSLPCPALPCPALPCPAMRSRVDHAPSLPVLCVSRN